MTPLFRRFLKRWMVFARKLADIQAVILFSIIYFTFGAVIFPLVRFSEKNPYRKMTKLWRPRSTAGDIKSDPWRQF